MIPLYSTPSKYIPGEQAAGRSSVALLPKKEMRSIREPEREYSCKLPLVSFENSIWIAFVAGFGAIKKSFAAEFAIPKELIVMQDDVSEQAPSIKITAYEPFTVGVKVCWFAPATAWEVPQFIHW